MERAREGMERKGKERMGRGEEGKGNGNWEREFSSLVIGFRGE